jgi:hypothetical protein
MVDDTLRNRCYSSHNPLSSLQLLGQMTCSLQEIMRERHYNENKMSGQTSDL